MKTVKESPNRELDVTDGSLAVMYKEKTFWSTYILQIRFFQESASNLPDQNYSRRLSPNYNLVMQLSR